MHDSFVFYYEWQQLIKSLPDEKRLKFFDAIFSNSRELSPDDSLDLHLSGVFNFIKAKLDENDFRYDERKKQLSEYGKKGSQARLSQAKPSQAKLRLDKPHVNDNDMLCHVNEEIKEKDKTIVLSKKEKPKKPIKEVEKKFPFGEFGLVFLTKKEELKLRAVYDDDQFNSIIKKLDAYKESDGKTYKSDYGAINNWVIEKVIGAPKIAKNNNSVWEKNPTLKEMEDKLNELQRKREQNKECTIIDV